MPLKPFILSSVFFLIPLSVAATVPDSRLLAKDTLPKAAMPTETIQNIRSDNPSIDADKIEASGIVWLTNQNQYLLISDEEYDQQPGLFALSASGTLMAQLSLSEDLKLDDLESISLDGQSVYVLSSLAYNKHDELKAKRKKIVRFNYQENQVTQLQSVDLFAVLTDITRNQPQAEAVQFLAQGLREHTLDVEAHFIKNNALYLGFKSPFSSGNATVIIKLSNLDTLFAGQKTSAEIWKTLALIAPGSGDTTQLSDMLLVDDALYLLSVSRSVEKNSYLWRYLTTDNQLQLIKAFAGVNAEGISYRADLAQFRVVFDEGKGRPSKYLSFTLTPGH
jgi:hypothetical protein